ncbi:LysE family translocator [Boseongicola aestuarii]
MRSVFVNSCAMWTETLLALITFAFVTSITPGPNNLMLMASGANFGFQRTIPHMLGVALGFVFMAFLMGLGLAQAFERWPWLRDVLTVVSVVYMLWLAWKIANAAAPKAGVEAGTPITFLQAAGFQWVNPKAWSMALTSVTLYAPNDSALAMLFVAGVFGAVNLPSVSVWCLLGREMRRILTNPLRLRLFNWAMAGVLVASLYPAVM